MSLLLVIFEEGSARLAQLQNALGGLSASMEELRVELDEMATRLRLVTFTNFVMWVKVTVLSWGTRPSRSLFRPMRLPSSYG